MTSPHQLPQIEPAIVRASFLPAKGGPKVDPEVDH